MYRLHTEVLVFSFLLATCCGASEDAVNADLVNSKVFRTVDLSSHLPKISNTITLENGGSAAVRSFLFAVDPALSDKLSFIGAMTKSSEEDRRLTVAETTVSSHKGKKFYRIDLPNSLGAGRSLTVDVETVFSNSLRPYPAQIAQSEKQYVQFNADLFFYSPYKTTTQTTTVKCATSTIESYTKTKPVSTSDSTISYGPYEKKDSFSESPLAVHYENNNAFLSVTSMERLVEVSHWGNIAIEETMDLRHSGAVLKGPFSRYDYQRSQDGVSSVKSFKTILPASARDVYYRDEIGNISTSHLKELEDSVELEIRPRFPLFGGWKTHYYIGYNVPSYQYLYNQGDDYLLKMRFIDHVFDDQVVDDLTVRVILPEGAKNIKLKTPFGIKRGKDETHYTYLDTMGRPVVVMHKQNLVEQHIQDFELHYTFQKLLLLQEPLLVVGAFYLLFALVIIYVRLDFSITKDEASEAKMRVAGMIEQLQGVQDRRSALYQSYEDAINKFKSSKDGSSFNSNRKKIDADHKQLTQQISTLLAKLKVDAADVAEKIAELQRLDTQIREQINLAVQQAEKLISGKMQKQQYLDMEATISGKRDEICMKMETLLASL